MKDNQTEMRGKSDAKRVINDVYDENDPEPDIADLNVSEDSDNGNRNFDVQYDEVDADITISSRKAKSKTAVDTSNEQNQTYHTSSSTSFSDKQASVTEADTNSSRLVLSQSTNSKMSETACAPASITSANAVTDTDINVSKPDQSSSAGHLHCRIDFANFKDSPMPKEGYQCKILCPSSDEGIRGIYIEGGSLAAVIGDDHVKKFPMFHQTDCVHVPFKRSHSYGTCATTVVQFNENKVALVSPDENCLIAMDLANLNNQLMSAKLLPKVSVPNKAVSAYFDGLHFISIQHGDAGDQKVVKVQKTDTGEALQLYRFRSDKNHYWGFFIIGGDKLLHASKSNFIKVWSLSSNIAPIYQMQVHKNGKLLAMLPVNNGELLVTLGSDQKIKIWKGQQLVCKAINIKGNFDMGYPVLLRKFANMIFYTTNDAIYVVSFPSHVLP